ncbi:hypothetical protein DL95DRAFT_470866 [Leptodontidium sp. 2 PMI_412]|nr:hypothetical protein DL95DRAFT_470866 [Leptodontidium sp. 2 PMI_412]
MFPNGIASPGHATSGECVNIPITKGINYNSVEIDNDFHSSERSVQTFCVQNCRSTSGYSAPQRDTYCYQPPKNCAIGSL